MNVISMMREIDVTANSMIGESALPHLLFSANDSAQLMRIRAFDHLDRALNGYVVRRSEQEMNMFRHYDESLQGVAAVATIAVKSFQEDAHIDFDDKQFTPVESREGDEVSSGWRKESSRLQEQTSAAGSRTSFPTLNWHEWNSCPSRLFFTREFSFWERLNVQ